MVGFGPIGSAPIGAIPEYRDLALSIESADWTGIERRLATSAETVDQIRSMLRDIDRAVEETGLTNHERARAKALSEAMLKLVESPEPEWKLIARVLVNLLDSKPVKAAKNAAWIIGTIYAVICLISDQSPL